MRGLGLESVKQKHFLLWVVFINGHVQYQQALKVTVCVAVMALVGVEFCSVRESKIGAAGFTSE